MTGPCGDRDPVPLTAGPFFAYWVNGCQPDSCPPPPVFSPARLRLRLRALLSLLGLHDSHLTSHSLFLFIAKAHWSILSLSYIQGSHLCPH